MKSLLNGFNLKKKEKVDFEYDMLKKRQQKTVNSRL